MDDFYEPAAKKSVAAAASESSSGSTMPLIVAVQHRAGSYPEAPLRAGALVALLYLALFLYFPEPFDAKWLVFEVVGAFLLGALAALSSESVWRTATTKARRAEAVSDAARRMFAASKDEGVLVFVATGEAQVDVVMDAATRVELGPVLDEIEKKLDRAVRLDRDRERFERALRELGEALTEAFPDPDAPQKAADEPEPAPAGDADASSEAATSDVRREADPPADPDDSKGTGASS